MPQDTIGFTAPVKDTHMATVVQFPQDHILPWIPPAGFEIRSTLPLQCL